MVKLWHVSWLLVISFIGSMPLVFAKNINTVEHYRLPLVIHHEIDRSDVPASAHQELDWLAQKFLQMPKEIQVKSEVIVSGYVERAGAREYDLALSERQAKSVSFYLIQRGVDAKHITVIACGSYKPIALGNGSLAKAKNRRTVVTIGSVNNSRTCLD